jgi:hypothetical protein
MIVEGPNGIRVDFPDGTDDATINNVMKQAYRESLVAKRDGLDKSIENSTLGGMAAGIGKDVDDNVRLAANGMSFGFLDKALGQDERAKTNAARDRQGFTGMGSEALGSMATGGMAGKAGLTASRLPWLGKYLGLTMDGAAMGGLNAYGNDQDVGTGALVGGVAGGIGQLANAGINKAYSAFNKPSVPSLDELGAQKSAAYGAVDASGAQYTPEQLAILKQGIADDMAAGRMHPAINPKVSAVNDIVGEDLGKGPMTLSDLDRTRQVVGQKIFQNAPTADDSRLGGQMLANFDEFIDATPPAVGGDNTTAVDALKQARELHKRMSKSEVIAEALDKATRRTSATGSGGNIDNATRQRINAIIDNKRLSRQFNKEELTMMRKIVDGSGTGNAMRLAGKLSPSGNGLMAALGVGGAMTNPILGIPALVGIGAKAGADRTTKKMAEDLMKSVLSGGNYKAKTLSPGTQKQVEDMIRAMLAGGTTIAASQSR